MANLDNAKEIGFGLVSQGNIATYAPEAVVTSNSTPVSPVDGLLWFSPSEYALRVWDGDSWQIVKSSFAALGGTIVDYAGYRAHVFTSSGTFSITKGTADIEYAIVAGGAGTGVRHSGGGGAGGVIRGTLSTVGIGTYSVVVGAGGAASVSYAVGDTGGNGGNSSLFGNTAIGGGHGGTYRDTSGNNSIDAVGGGSGGGAPYSRSAGAGTTGQGYAGGVNASNVCGGGGGGAGGVGGAGNNIGGDGGVGVIIDLDGNNYYYAGGGGGSSWDQVRGGHGGAGGGGGGGYGSGSYAGTYGLGDTSGRNPAGDGKYTLGDGDASGGNGGVNTGGGGGGCGQGAYGSYFGHGGAGGSGIVILRYAN